MVNLTLNHIKLLNSSAKSKKPCLGGLFETIYRYAKMTDMSWSLPVRDKSGRLLHIHFFVEITIEKKLLISCFYKGEQKISTMHLGYKGEGIIISKPKICVAHSHQAEFELVNFAIKTNFHC